MEIKIKSKLSCLLWCIKNGIIVPRRYGLSKSLFAIKESQHNIFSYGKFERCGKEVRKHSISWMDDTYECDGYEYHKDCLIINNQRR